MHVPGVNDQTIERVYLKRKLGKRRKGMAVYEQLEQEQSSPFLLDVLYCEEEEKWEEEEEDDIEGGGVEDNHLVTKHSNPLCLLPKPQIPKSLLVPLLLLEQDLCWEDDELHSLFYKEEQQQQNLNLDYSNSSSAICLARKEAVEWMLKVNAHFGFSTLTAILSINYLDRFLASLDHFKQTYRTENNNNKPWMFQLAAVTCVSLAAKVEETHVPLLLDLQEEGPKYLFEARTIQKMELFVLSTLGWRMNPVTPISFADHIIRRLGLKTHIHWEFLRRFERFLLSVVADSRLVRYLPSVLATATMMHVIDQIETSNPLDCQNHLLAVLNISKDNVKDCYNHMVEISSNSNTFNNHINKRKIEEMIVPSSPSGVVDAYFSTESSNDSWSTPTLKKSRVHEQHMPLPSLSSVSLDTVDSPR